MTIQTTTAERESVMNHAHITIRLTIAVGLLPTKDYAPTLKRTTYVFMDSKRLEGSKTMTPCFTVRTTILRELMADREFIEKLEKATKMVEVELILRQYAKKKRIKVAQIELEETKS